MNKAIRAFFFITVIKCIAFIPLGLASDSISCIDGFCEDVPIGNVDGTALSLNIAFPKEPTSTTRPVVVLIHGGGFISGDKASKNRQIKKLATLGFVAVSAEYRLAPEHRFPKAIEDIKLAIRFLKANAKRYHINPERIIVSGSSAGSYLAVMVGVTGNAEGFSDYGLYTEFDDTVRAVAAQSAPIGNYTLEKYRNTATVKRLLGDEGKINFRSLTAMSPVTYLDSNDPPLFLSHGDQDSIVPVDMSREFVKQLDRLGLQYHYHEVEGGTHSLSKSAPQQAREVFKHYIQFLKTWAR